MLEDDEGKLRRMPRKLTSLDGLWTAIQEAWDCLEQKKINRMIDSMENRRIEVIGKHGQATGR
jgi:hypothetical protein